MNKEDVSKNLGKMVLVEIFYDDAPFLFEPDDGYVEGILEDILLKSGRVYHKLKENKQDRNLMHYLDSDFEIYVVNITECLLKNGIDIKLEYDNGAMGYVYASLDEMTSLDNNDMMTEEQLKLLSWKKLARLRCAVLHRDETDMRNKYLKNITDLMAIAKVKENIIIYGE